MFESVHRKLESNLKFYRDWHKSPSSGIANASFFLLFCLLLSCVVWMSYHADFLRNSSANLILGASTDPSNLSYIAERTRLGVSPYGFNNDGSFIIVVTTSKEASVWAEYDDGKDGNFKRTELSNSGFAHIVTIHSNEIVEGNTYVYKIGAVDTSGVVVYSRTFSFQK